MQPLNLTSGFTPEVCFPENHLVVNCIQHTFDLESLVNLWTKFYFKYAYLNLRNCHVTHITVMNMYTDMQFQKVRGGRDNVDTHRDGTVTGLGVFLQK